MKTDELLYELLDEMSVEETEFVDEMVLRESDSMEAHQRRTEQNSLKRQENLTMHKIQQALEENSKTKGRIYGKRRIVLLAATFILIFGMVGFAKEKDWDIEMAEMLGISDVMEELDGGYVKVGISDTSENVTLTASQLIGDKNCMWLQLDTDVPWNVEEGGYYLFEDSWTDCYHRAEKPLTGGETWYSFNNNGYVSFMWQFADYDNINRSTIKIWVDKLVAYQPADNEEDEEITTVISEGTWQLEWENCYAANTVVRYPFKKVTCKNGNEEMECVIREIEVSPVSIQIKGWKSPFDDVDGGYSLLEAVKLKDGTIIQCAGSSAGMGNFYVDEFLSIDYAPELDMSEIEYVTIGGEDIKIAK